LAFCFIVDIRVYSTDHFRGSGAMTGNSNYDRRLDGHQTGRARAFAILTLACLLPLTTGCRLFHTPHHRPHPAPKKKGKDSQDPDSGLTPQSISTKPILRSQTPQAERPPKWWGHAPIQPDSLIFSTVDEYDDSAFERPQENYVKGTVSDLFSQPEDEFVRQSGFETDSPDQGRLRPFDANDRSTWDYHSGMSFEADLHDLFPTLWGDVTSLMRWESAIILGAAAGVSVAFRDNVDGEVRAYTAESPNRWGGASSSIGLFGEITYQVPAIFAVYGVSLWTEDEKLHECSKAVISAFGITAVSTIALKRIADTQRPTMEIENGRYGFPSYHASSTFSIAAVLDEYYGWQVGLPSYALAGLVAWSRIDDRAHDLSDVVFGSALGFVIGKSVALSHLDRVGKFQVLPYYDPAIRGFGFNFEARY